MPDQEIKKTEAETSVGETGSDERVGFHPADPGFKCPHCDDLHPHMMVVRWAHRVREEGDIARIHMSSIVHPGVLRGHAEAYATFQGKEVAEVEASLKRKLQQIRDYVEAAHVFNDVDLFTASLGLVMSTIPNHGILAFREMDDDLWANYIEEVSQVEAKERAQQAEEAVLPPEKGSVMEAFIKSMKNAGASVSQVETDRGMAVQVATSMTAEQVINSIRGALGVLGKAPREVKVTLADPEEMLDEEIGEEAEAPEGVE